VTAYADSASSQLGMLETCPLLGIDEDRASHFEFPSGAHRCYARAAVEIALDHQSRYCLGGTYRSCPRFTLEPAAIEPEAPTRNYRRALTLLAVPLVVAVVAVTVALALFGGFNGNNGGIAGVPSPTVTPLVTVAPSTGAPATPAAAPSASPIATQLATAAPTPPPSPTPTATPVPTPVPTKRPHDKFIYVVKAHDTLSSIARRFGVTMNEIIELNNLENPNLLHNGQELIIPKP
jgi:LysM repeat protein